MKNGKALGLDGISSEVLKLGGEASVHWLSSIFTTMWMESTVSSDWQKQLLVPIHLQLSRYLTAERSQQGLYKDHLQPPEVTC